MTDTQTDAYVDIDSVQTAAEELGTVVSQDFNDRPLTTPGRYISESRKIKPKMAGDKMTGVFQIDFAGLVDRANGRKFFRPDRTWVSTKTFRKRDFSSGDKEHPAYFPGETSTVADYLVACGYSRQTVRALSGAALLSALQESQHRPVGVKTGLRDRGKKQADGSYGKSKFYTKDFKIGGDNGSDAHYARTIERDGETFEASEVVEGFFKATA